MKSKMSLFVILRLVIGGIFVVSGFEKLLSPLGNFLAVIKEYDVLPFSSWEYLSALVFPWVELFLGVFLILGLWTRQVLFLCWLCVFTFIVIVGQALVRNLPLASCGCFGDLLKVPLQFIFGMDTTMAVIILLLIKYVPKTRLWSFDQYYLSRNE